MAKYKYQKKDFVINRIQRRKYGDQWLSYVNIKNLKTGTVFEDWIRPDQIKTVEGLNKLINWEVKSEKKKVEKKKKKGIEIENFNIGKYRFLGIRKYSEDGKSYYRIMSVTDRTLGKYGRTVKQFLNIEANNKEELEKELKKLLKI